MWTACIAQCGSHYSDRRIGRLLDIRRLTSRFGLRFLLSALINLSTTIAVLEADVQSLVHCGRPGLRHRDSGSPRSNLAFETESGGSWIVDGNYRFLADVTWARADLIIWLDFPLYVNLWRRTVRLSATRENSAPLRDAEMGYEAPITCRMKLPALIGGCRQTL